MPDAETGKTLFELPAVRTLVVIVAAVTWAARLLWYTGVRGYIMLLKSN